MKPARIFLLIASIALSAALALAARDLVYVLVVVPLSYVSWQFGVIFRAVPELVWWTALVVAAALVIAWQLVPDLKPASRDAVRQLPAVGQVEALALWLRRSRTSNYFKWQLAHRLGRVSRRQQELTGRSPEGEATDTPVARYLAAGIDHSFVDFPSPRRIFDRAEATPLDVDPGDVVDLLESQVLVDRGNHANRL